MVSMSSQLNCIREKDLAKKNLLRREYGQAGGAIQAVGISYDA